MTRRGWLYGFYETRWGTLTRRGRVNVQDDDSTRITRGDAMTRRGWFDQAKWVDEDYSMSHDEEYLNLKIIVVRVCWEWNSVDSWMGHLFFELRWQWYLFFPLFEMFYFYWHYGLLSNLFGFFILLINALFWVLHVSFHFHLLLGCLWQAQL